VGGQCPAAALFWVAALLVKRRRRLANGLSRMNLKLDLDLGFGFLLRLDLPYVPGLGGTVPV